MEIGNRKEQRLVERLRNGENGAMQEFYALYARYLTAVCARYVADDESVKDVLQDALITIFTRIADFNYCGEGSLRAWAARITANKSVDFLKAAKRHELMAPDCDVIDETGEMEETDEIPISDIPPEEIHRMVSDLPTGYRTVFNLYVFESKSHREIAQLLGIRETTSATQLFKARKLLARKLEEYGNVQQTQG